MGGEMAAGAQDTSSPQVQHCTSCMPLLYLSVVYRTLALGTTPVLVMRSCSLMLPSLE